MLARDVEREDDRGLLPRDVDLALRSGEGEHHRHEAGHDEHGRNDGADAGPCTRPRRGAERRRLPSPAPTDRAVGEQT